MLKYTFVDGSKNDTVEIFINPAKGNEPTQADLSANANAADASTTMGLQGITLRQGSASTKVGPDVLIDAIRVTDSWADLWQDGGSVDPDPDPQPGNGVITPAETSIELGTFYQYMKYTTTVNIKAQDLTENINVSVSGSELKLGTSVIPAEEATSATGYNLEITYTAGPADLNETITLSSPGAEDATIPSSHQPIRPQLSPTSVSSHHSLPTKSATSRAKPQSHTLTTPAIHPLFTHRIFMVAVPN